MDTEVSDRPLTARQAEILDFIRDFTRREQMPPTLREIGRNFGIRSTNGVADHLAALERKGRLRRGSMKSRALFPVGVDVVPAPVQVATLWRAENAALRRLLGRVLVAATRGTMTLTAEMVVALGDVRAVLTTPDLPLSIETDEHRRDEGDDALAEERAERERDRRERTY